MAAVYTTEKFYFVKKNLDVIFTGFENQIIFFFICICQKCFNKMILRLKINKTHQNNVFGIFHTFDIKHHHKS